MTHCVFISYHLHMTIFYDTAALNTLKCSFSYGIQEGHFTMLQPKHVMTYCFNNPSDYIMPITIATIILVSILCS